jgi:hypothetical protein
MCWRYPKQRSGYSTLWSVPLVLQHISIYIQHAKSFSLKILNGLQASKEQVELHEFVALVQKERYSGVMCLLTPVSSRIPDVPMECLCIDTPKN